MKRRILASFLALFFLFALGAIGASFYITKTSEEFGRLVELHEVENLRRGLVISLQTVQADLYTAHTPLSRDLDAIVSNVVRMDQAARDCTSCHHSSKVREKLSRILDLIEDYKDSLSYYITLRANRDRLDNLKTDAAAIGDELLELTEEMSTIASSRLFSITAEARERINDARAILLATVLSAFVLGAAISIYLARSITKPIVQLVAATKEIAGGNLDKRVERGGLAEFDELGRNFNAMTLALKQSYRHLREANENLQAEITERMRAEEESQRLQSRLLHAMKMESVGILSSGIAHEFNNLLQIVTTCVDRLASRWGRNRTPPKELALIATSAERGASLTRRLLEFARKGESSLRPLDLNQRVREVASILQRTLPKNIEIHVEPSQEVLPVRADPSQLEQVLLNLALNAKDAMPQGGVLRLTTGSGSLDSCAPLKRDRTGDGECARLTVSDTGLGMDEDTLKHIYDPFFTTKDIGSGTGLGLSTVYGIVADHGGQISCRSSEGKGTTFTVCLPVDRSASQNESFESPLSTAVPQDDKKTILLVDDEEPVLELLKEGLEECGYTVHTASKGEEGLLFFAEHGDELDAVLLDLGMPGMGGMTCLRRMLEMKRDAKIVVATGHATRDHERQAMESGAAGFVGKPYRVQDIVRTVNDVLSDSHPTPSLDTGAPAG